MVEVAEPEAAVEPDGIVAEAVFEAVIYCCCRP